MAIYFLTKDFDRERNDWEYNVKKTEGVGYILLKITRQDVKAIEGFVKDGPEDDESFEKRAIGLFDSYVQEQKDIAAKVSVTIKTADF